MDKPTKFLLPKPDFSKKDTKSQKSAPHYLTPSGMTLLPRDKQPPPMYGPKGSTIPPRFIVQAKQCQTEQQQERHFCEPCEMELQTMDDFRRHRAQHERCPVDGCKYKAHPSVMDKHVTELHASGIFDKIKKISTPEEIAAWREERRKKYPTLANAQMRQLAKEQRQRRGERLEENKSRFGRHEDRKRARNMDNDQPPRVTKKSQHPRKNKAKDKKRIPRTLGKPAVEKEALARKETEKLEAKEETFSKGMPMFEGTSKMKDYKHEKTKKKQSQNVLSGLLGMYGSDNDDNSYSEEDEEEDSVHSAEEKQFSTAKENMPSTFQQCQPDDVEMIDENASNKGTTDTSISYDSNKVSCKATIVHKEASRIESKCLSPQNDLHSSHQSDVIVSDITEDKNTKESSDEEPEEAPIERTTLISYDPPTTSNNMDNKSIAPKLAKQENPKKNLQVKRKYGLNYRKVRLRKQNTMLEKLLEPDIRHERNVLLQCVRFVCQNDFFGIGKKNTVIDNATTA